MKKILIIISTILLTSCSIGNKDNDSLDSLTNTYINKDLDFSINYPKAWSLTNYKEWTGSEIMSGTLDKETKTIEGAFDITFANTQEKFNNIFEIPKGYQSVTIRIYKVTSSSYNSEGSRVVVC